MKEEDIRKRDVFNRYLNLVRQDAESFFDFGLFVKVNCPACSSTGTGLEFKKSGFQYVTCNRCSTLFVNPRPSLEMLGKFYVKSSSSSYWVNEFFKPTVEARREKIFKPRAAYIRDILAPDKESVIGDVGAGFGIFLEELKRLLPANRYIAIEPSAEMASICRSKGLEVRESFFEQIQEGPGTYDLLTSFELTEHLFDPETFFRKTQELLKPGGLLFLTTLNGFGFDISMLWERSKSVMPPHHLNFFNPESIRIMLERSGFSIIELSTPGKLDWDIVEGMIKNEDVSMGRFWDNFALSGNDTAKQALQDWISSNSLSSHMRVLAVKKPSEIREKGHGTR